VAQTPDWVEVQTVVQERLVQRFPVFARRPVQDGSAWYWEDDLDLHLAHHIHRARLTESASVDRLREYVAARRSRPFDRSRPLGRGPRQLGDEQPERTLHRRAQPLRKEHQR
jgi:hypothetical protein